MTKKVYFDLTEDQKEILAPLFKQVHEAVAKDERGLILGQINEDFFSVAAFIPEKYAIKMNNIMQDWRSIAKY